MAGTAPTQPPRPAGLEALLLGTLGTLLYLLTAPSMVNSDGLGYLKLLPHNFAAGHLLYMPLLRATTQLVGDGLRAGRLLNALLGGTGLVLTYGLARRVLRLLPLGRPFTDEDVRFAAIAATVLLGLSYGYWVESADVEAYSAALVAMLATLRLLSAWMARPTVARAAAVGVLLGLSVLCHLTHVMLAVPCAIIMASTSDRNRGRWHAVLALGLGGVIALSAYLYAAIIVRGQDLAGALRWVATAAHGFRDGAGIWRLGDAVAGLSKALVYSPYLYEGDGPRMMTLFLCGFLPLVWALRLVWRERGSFTTEVRRAALAWVVPYGLVGLLFFGSDVERWVFVLPALCVATGAVLARRPRRRTLLVVAAGYLLLLNWLTAIGPMHRDTRVKVRAVAAAQATQPGDLLVFPGHSWDEYVPLYARGRVEPFPLAYYVARDGEKAALDHLEADARRVIAAGGRLVSLRLFGDFDGDARGFEEMQLLGVGRKELEADLSARFEISPLDPGSGAVRLVPRAGHGTKPP